ncbi:MAG: hypothetical protein ACREJO_00125 [Phycisphaerales bacterium]
MPIDLFPMTGFADMSNFYTKLETDGLLAAINISDYYNKAEVDAMISGFTSPDAVLKAPVGTVNTVIATRSATGLKITTTGLDELGAVTLFKASTAGDALSFKVTQTATGELETTAPSFFTGAVKIYKVSDELYESPDDVPTLSLIVSPDQTDHYTMLMPPALGTPGQYLRLGLDGQTYFDDAASEAPALIEGEGIALDFEDSAGGTVISVGDIPEDKIGIGGDIDKFACWSGTGRCFFTLPDHGRLTGLADDDHLQYVHLSPNATNRNRIIPAGNYPGLKVQAPDSGFGSATHLFQVNGPGGTDSYIDVYVPSGGSPHGQVTLSGDVYVATPTDHNGLIIQSNGVTGDPIDMLRILDSGDASIFSVSLSDDNSGNVTLGSLHNLVMSGGQIVASTAGGYTAPAYCFAGDTDTGVYYHGTDTVGIAAGGSKIAIFDSAGFHVIGSTQILAPAGSASAPGLTFTSDTNSGMYSVGADSVGIAAASPQLSPLRQPPPLAGQQQDGKRGGGGPGIRHPAI